MPFIPVGAAVASAGVGLYTSGQQADAIKSAQDSANATQKAEETQARTDLAPYNAAGSSAVKTTADLSGANGLDAATAAQANFLKSPGYDFQLSEGLRAVDQGAASKGILHSGATIKAETAYGEGLAQQDFTSYYNRLSDLAKLGENAGAKTGDQGVTTGQGIASTDTSGASALASIYGNAGKAVNNSLTNYFDNSAYGSSLNALSGGGGAPVSYGGTPNQLGNMY